MPPEAKFQKWALDPANVAPALPSNVLPQRHLAFGGQGAVFDGHVDGVRAAIKVYYPGQHGLRIEREIELLRQLRSSVTVALLWHGTLDFYGSPLPVVATEFFEGTDLSVRLQAGPLTDGELCTVAQVGASAIEELWTRRIVHRDIKPQNIMLDQTRACVIDLGLARHLDQSSLTAMGVVWGTWGYLSPEQAKGVRALTCKSDIYSLGVTLLHAMNGRHPTNGDQLALFARNLADNPPPWLATSKWSAILTAMVRSRPTQRPTPVEVLAAFSKT